MPPRFDQRKDSFDDPIKMILMGDSGTGKTGALAVLANSGWELRIVDLDNGIKILGQYLTDEGAKRVHYITLTDHMSSTTQGLVIPKGAPKTWLRVTQLLEKWQDPENPEENLGRIEEWDSNKVLVIDSLTFLSAACMRYVQYRGISGMREAPGSAKILDRWAHPYPRDFGEAQELLESLFTLLYETRLKCNVIVTAHIRYLGGGGQQSIQDKETGEIVKREVDSEALGQGYPLTIGRQLSPKIGRFFNTVVMMKSIGSGSSAKRQISTVSEERIALKTERPKDTPPYITIEGGTAGTGLAKLFEILKGKK